MSPERFRALAIEIYGQIGHQRHMARLYGEHQAVVRRWCLGQVPIPEKAIVDLRAAAAEKLGTVGKLLA